MHDSKTHTRAHTHREKYVQRNIDFNKNKTKNTKNVHTRIWSTNYRLNSRFIKPLQCVVQAIFHSNNDQTLTIRLFVLVYSVLVCLCRLVVVFSPFRLVFLAGVLFHTTKCVNTQHFGCILSIFLSLVCFPLYYLCSSAFPSTKEKNKKTHRSFFSP